MGLKKRDSLLVDLKTSFSTHSHCVWMVNILQPTHISMEYRSGIWFEYDCLDELIEINNKKNFTHYELLNATHFYVIITVRPLLSNHFYCCGTFSVFRSIIHVVFLSLLYVSSIQVIFFPKLFQQCFLFIFYQLLYRFFFSSIFQKWLRFIAIIQFSSNGKRQISHECISSGRYQKLWWILGRERARKRISIEKLTRRNCPIGETTSFHYLCTNVSWTHWKTTIVKQPYTFNKLTRLKYKLFDF